MSGRYEMTDAQGNPIIKMDSAGGPRTSQVWAVVGSSRYSRCSYAPITPWWHVDASLTYADATTASDGYATTASDAADVAEYDATTTI